MVTIIIWILWYKHWKNTLTRMWSNWSSQRSRSWWSNNSRNWRWHLLSLLEQFIVWLCENKGCNQPFLTVQNIQHSCTCLIPLPLREVVPVWIIKYLTITSWLLIMSPYRARYYDHKTQLRELAICSHSIPLCHSLHSGDGGTMVLWNAGIL